MNAQTTLRNANCGLRIRTPHTAIRNTICFVAFTLLQGGLSAQSFTYTKGQNVAPAYEGWEQASDGDQISACVDPVALADFGRVYRRCDIDQASMDRIG